MGQRISARLQECRDVFSTRIKQGHAALGFVVPYVSDVNVIASFLDAGNRKGQRILAKADSLLSSVSETVFDDRYIASRCAVVRESNGAYHVAT